uniref:NADH-ubiquinone oxidoreductase chain 5 n=1 Tax=Sabella spallanzanii TaxID=85702 RepID=A0A7T1WKB5_SABSP|nr:NADH dehydrogenase subunit 5 [Sabella spallanzanii]QPO99965.1 NADH dehydrogenase subunit 5 [Sabella spallanzanii]
MSFKPSSMMPAIFYLTGSISLVISLYLIMQNTTLILSWELLTVSSFSFNFDIILDEFSSTLILVVLAISSTIFLFSKTYMNEDPLKDRFTLILSLFVTSMLLLTLSPNLVTLLLGWDGLGITSFVLVMYYQNPKSLAGAMLTVLTNRFGDALILVAIIMAVQQNQLNIMYMHTTPQMMILPWLIMLAATTKSAQIPFVSWLPAAMAAPTPVSALVHSSTLVTAGVYLLVRLSPTLENTPAAKYLLIMSSLTIFLASMSALMENDLKKIIALSTLSQLGVMMMSLAFNLQHLAFFHLITHALFKALMFMCAGTIIMLNGHTQDLRLSSNIASQMPMTAAALLTSTLALSGFPYLAGFYSKDLILEMMMQESMNWIPLIIMFTATTLTSTYAARLVLIVLSGTNTPFKLNTMNMNSTDISFPSLTLSTASMIIATVVNWTIMHPLPHPTLSNMEKFTPLVIMIMGFYMAVAGPADMGSAPLKIHSKITSMWFLTPLSTQMILSKPLHISNTTIMSLEKGWMEFAGPTTLKMIMTTLANKLKNMEQMNIPSQMLFASMFMMFMFAIIMH